MATFITVDGKFNTEAEAIENVRSEQISRMQPCGDRLPVCVKTQISKKKFSYGVQFWTPKQMVLGTSQNTDNTTAILCK